MFFSILGSKEISEKIDAAGCDHASTRKTNPPAVSETQLSPLDHIPAHVSVKVAFLIPDAVLFPVFLLMSVSLLYLLFIYVIALVFLHHSAEENS